MLTEYIKAAMKRAKYGIMEDDSTFFGEVPEIEGAWGNAPTLEECRDDLESAIEDWLLISLQHHQPIPIIDGLDLNPKREIVELETYQPA
ncbi:MAG: type II toxin-antitoxin system HicB family antitoxin [Calditrichota bacterium]